MKTIAQRILVITLLIFSISLIGQTTVGPYTFYPTNVGGTMQGQAQINGVAASAGDIIAAFSPDPVECVGAATVTMYGGVAYINFVIYGDDGAGHGMAAGEAFTLKLYDVSATTEYTYSTALTGWQNTMFAPMPGFDNPNTVYNFLSCIGNVTPTNQNVSATSGSTTFSITSNTTWTVADNATWLTVSPSSGSNNGTITATYSSNNTGAVRTANITVTFGSTCSPVVVTVTQAACSMTVTPTVQNVPASPGGTTTFTVNTTCSWTASESASWFTISPTSGTGNGTITVTYDANTGAQRSANISVNVTGLPTTTVQVVQAGQCSLTVTPASQNVTACSGTTTFSLNTTCAWTVAESVSWFTVSPMSGTGNATLTVTYDANAGVARSGNLTVTVTGVTPVTVSVNQSACSLTVTPANQNVTYLSGTTTFSVTTCSNWTVTDNASWLAVSPASGTGNATITATYSANSSCVDRVATITVVGCGSTISVPVTVTQAFQQKTITVASENPASGVPITVTPNDVNGQGNGTTQFTRTYCFTSSVTLTAPTSTSGNTFTEWQKNGSFFSINPSITFTASANDTYKAVYENTLSVSLPDTTVLYASTVEIPVYVTNTSGLGILSCQFTVNFDNTVIVPASPYYLTSGTLTGTAGWTFAANAGNPGQIIIAGAGSTVLNGSGKLLKLKFNVVGDRGDQTPLDFIDFDFNAGNPVANTVDGSLLIQPKVCGDVDLNTLIQAYDASLVLQYVVGSITLSPQALINADVDEDGFVTAFDAALILIHVVGGTQPVPTCFTTDQGFYAGVPDRYIFKAKLINLASNSYLTTADIVLEGIRETSQVFGVSFDIYSPNAQINALTFPDMPNGYMMAMNPTDGHTYRVAIINTNGVLTDDLKMHLEMTNFGDGAMLSMSNIVINNTEMPGIRLNGPVSAETTVSESLIVYPNPFNSTTNITWEVNEDSQVVLEVLDMFGRKVTTLADQFYTRGFYNAVWNGENKSGHKMQPGWYLVKLTAEGTCQQIKINLMH